MDLDSMDETRNLPLAGQPQSGNMISMASVNVSNCNVKHHNMLYDG